MHFGISFQLLAENFEVVGAPKPAAHVRAVSRRFSEIFVFKLHSAKELGVFLVGDHEID